MFNLDKVYSSKRIDEFATNNKEFDLELTYHVLAYMKHDWGNVPLEERKRNDQAFMNNDSILAKYETSQGDIIITTFPGSEVTYIQFGDEEYPITGRYAR